MRSIKAFFTVDPEKSCLQIYEGTQTIENQNDRNKLTKNMSMQIKSYKDKIFGLDNKIQIKMTHLD